MRPRSVLSVLATLLLLLLVPPFAGTGTAAATGSAAGPLPAHFLTGYWHNFDNPARELRLSEVPDEYDLIAVAFGEATARAGEVAFGVDPGLSASLGGYTDAQFKADVAALRAGGKKVILPSAGNAARSRWATPVPPRCSRNRSRG